MGRKQPSIQSLGILLSPMPHSPTLVLYTLQQMEEHHHSNGEISTTEKCTPRLSPPSLLVTQPPPQQLTECLLHLREFPSLKKNARKSQASLKDQLARGLCVQPPTPASHPTWNLS
ncbi:ORF417 [White spot syndrome virus]|uniref:Wsv384 n=3 Tax=White spot syndrome virus TaxID=342409 RepID=Q8VAL7_WSSVS|nr:wsv384 [Shrimp white spot syndrome virus]AFX59761.1 wsv384 [White spot syndrome virus]AAL33386.1 wsv384 [Shrimp white spot syndrome virus]AAL89311.1 WSSV443 [Shrimp white spot syndrome virus]ATU83581.1 ORF417 [White spot syndrome virus]AWQ60509.1 wsv384 [Shrimp white spot syndrome virus]